MSRPSPEYLTVLTDLNEHSISLGERPILFTLLYWILVVENLNGNEQIVQVDNFINDRFYWFLKRVIKIYWNDLKISIEENIRHNIFTYRRRSKFLVKRKILYEDCGHKWNGLIAIQFLNINKRTAFQRRKNLLYLIYWFLNIYILSDIIQ